MQNSQLSTSQSLVHQGGGYDRKPAGMGHRQFLRGLNPLFIRAGGTTRARHSRGATCPAVASQSLVHQGGGYDADAVLVGDGTPFGVCLNPLFIRAGGTTFMLWWVSLLLCIIFVSIPCSSGRGVRREWPWLPPWTLWDRVGLNPLFIRAGGTTRYVIDISCMQETVGVSIPCSSGRGVRRVLS